MQPHHSHNPYAYYGQPTDQGYPSQTRPQEPAYWSQEMYNSQGVQRPQHQPVPAGSWSMGHQSAHPQGAHGSHYPPPPAQWGAGGTGQTQGLPSHYTSGHGHHHNPSSPPHVEPSSRWPPAEPVAVHMYERLPSADKDVVDAWLEKDAEKRVYRCRANGCGKEFSSKDNARVHVHGKHLGESKLFRCIQCRTEFASEDGAKRHRDTATTKTFSCAYCSNTYARKDYRDLHQKKCTSRRAY